MVDFESDSDLRVSDAFTGVVGVGGVDFLKRLGIDRGVESAKGLEDVEDAGEEHSVGGVESDKTRLLGVATLRLEYVGKEEICDIFV